MCCVRTQKKVKGSERGVNKSITYIIDYQRTTSSTTLPTYNSSIPKLLEYFFLLHEG